ncbi:MAG: hypothetical protein AB7J28_11540 [Hyphomonadaceae bacterium]
MFEFLAILVFQAAAGQPSMQPSQQAPAAQQEQSAQAPEDRLICEMAPRVGSRIPQRICLSERDRRWLRERQQQALREGTRPIQACPAGNC